MPSRHPDQKLALVARDALEVGIAEACRKHGIHRSTWYRHQVQKPESDSPPSSSSALTEAIAKLALEHPEWGCDRIAYFLSFSDLKTSSPTVQKILIGLGLGRRSDRVRAVERARAIPLRSQG